jgi:hypothetical protein
MTQQQLRYVLTLLTTFDDTTVVKTYMLVRFTGVKPGLLQPWQAQSLIAQFDFIDPFDGMDVRLERIHGCRAVDDILDGYTFGDYLMAEQYYQLALMSGQEGMIERLATYLYTRRRRYGLLWMKSREEHPERLSLTPAEKLGTMRWMAHVKKVFAERWSYFFQRVEGTAEELDIDLMGAMDAQIRALTEGDITREERIKQMPCWRALTELNQKAREAKEFREKYKQSTNT